MSAVSLLESGEQRYVKAIYTNNNKEAVRGIRVHIFYFFLQILVYSD